MKLPGRPRERSVALSSTDRASALALSQLAGSLSERLQAIAERMADAAAEVEARVDFAEDVGGVVLHP